jgi:two-component system sensor histidine kinase YesM
MIAISLFHNIKNYLSYKISRKIIVIMTLIFVLIVSLIQIVIYFIYTPFLMNDAMNYDAKDVRAVSSRVDEAITNYNWFLDLIILDKDVQKLLGTKYTTRREELMLNYELERVLNAKSSVSLKTVDHIFVYDNEKLRGVMHNTSDFNDRYTHLRKDEYYEEGNIKWRTEEGAIEINRAIRDVKSLHTIGYIKIVIKDEYFKTLIQSPLENFIFVLNTNDSVVIKNKSSSDSFLLDVLKGANELKSGVPAIMDIKDHGEMLVTIYQSSYSLWKTVSVTPVDDITNRIKTIQNWIIEIVLVGLLLGLIIIRYSTNRIFRPLRQLTEVMDQVNQENFSLQAKIQSRDEIGRLSRSFNRMMVKIESLISEVYVKEIHRKDAEYKALKAQINPHFLYNTLDTIRWLAQFKETESISTVAVSLAKLMKGVISNKREYILIEEEMEYINAYLEIQNIRFLNKVDVSIHIDEELLSDCLIPAFIVQPIVENAFVHGIENKVGKSHLSINAYKDKNIVIFEIIDDGIGMDQQLVNALLSSDQTERKDKDSNGTGLLNVHNRICLLYGDNYGLTIHSKPNVGTEVHIVIPFVSHRRVI